MAKRNITLHDKHKSTTALYPKIDAKSLTPTAIEEITKITEEVVEEQVVPNPTPTGEEPNLEYITINNVTYKVPSGGSNHMYLYQLYDMEASYASSAIGGFCIEFQYPEFLGLATNIISKLKDILSPAGTKYLKINGIQWSRVENKVTAIFVDVSLDSSTNKLRIRAIKEGATSVADNYYDYTIEDNSLLISVIQLY